MVNRKKGLENVSVQKGHLCGLSNKTENIQKSFNGVQEQLFLKHK